MNNIRLAAAFAALSLVVTACLATAEDEAGSASPRTTAPAIVGPVTTLVVPASTAPPRTAAPTMTPQAAFAAIHAFDPAAGDPAALAAALEVAGPSASLELPVIIEHGSPAVRDVVFAALAGDPTWSLGILVGMQEYGMPSGTLESPRLWPSDVRSAIAETLRESANSYGQMAEMMVELNRRYLASEIEQCGDAGCDWGAVWYAAPAAVASPVGAVIDSMRFDGSVSLVADTGAGDKFPITVRRLDGWVPVEGFLAEVPPFGLDVRFGGPFEGAIVTDPIVTLAGWALPGTTIRAGEASAVVDQDRWELQVLVPTDGIIEILAEDASGASRAELLTVLHMPQASRQLAYITGVETTDSGQLALEVDYAEWFSGDAATEAARADGEIGPDEFVNNDYYIRNQNPRLRIIPVEADSVIRLIDATRDDLSPVAVPLAEFERIMLTGDDSTWFGAASGHMPYWLTVDGDRMIYQIQQQYIP